MTRLHMTKLDWKPRFFAKISMPDPDTGCMEWTGSKMKNGYGRFGLNRDFGPAVWFAHRMAYTYWVGPIPEGMDLDHLCRNRACVNPDHLEPKTRRDNLLASGSLSFAAKRAAVTHCPRGHEYTEANTRLSKRNQRNCRECARSFYEKKSRGE